MQPEQPPGSAASAAPGLPPSPPPALASEPPAGPRYPLRYGPIKPGDGLWRIARKLVPTGASVEQTAMALYRSNQDAFVGGDINKLIIGQTLQIPSEAELLALGAGEAKGEFMRALAGGKVRSAPLSGAAPDGENPAQTPEASRLTIVGAPEDAAAEDASDSGGAAEAADRQSAAAAEPESPTDIPPQQVAGLQEDLLLVRETSETNRQETQELRQRIGGLEEQLRDIKRLLEVQAEIARLQLEQTRAQMSGAQVGAGPAPGGSPLAPPLGAPGSASPAPSALPSTAPTPIATAPAAVPAQPQPAAPGSADAVSRAPAPQDASADAGGAPSPGSSHRLSAPFPGWRSWPAAW